MNDQTRQFIVALSLIGALSACTDKSEPSHNTKYYSDNPDARADMLKRCAKDQNTEDPMNCVAAEDAQLVAISGT